ncbi:hypothetical protein [Gordonia shandongensis]|uniref:hypothetical protein n=1 Tax=Gordonia shandongensis TaxID=376351 RepID=UPI000413B4F5|nr:hypothetical protein [Gordonia shandongensis]
MTDPAGASRRLTLAREEYAAAVAEEERARVAAGPAARRRSRRRAAGVRLAVLAAVIAAAVMAGVAGWAQSSGSSSVEAAARADAARRAADEAVTVMLTADPAHPDEYVRTVRAVTTGDQRSRVDRTAADLRDFVAGQPSRMSGRILSSAIVDEPGVDAGAATGGAATDGEVTVLLVVQASRPELVGGEARGNRVGLTVTMVDRDGRWLVNRAEAVS